MWIKIATGFRKFDSHELLKLYIYLCIEHNSSKHTSRLSGFVFKIMGTKAYSKLNGVYLWNQLII